MPLTAAVSGLLALRASAVDILILNAGFEEPELDAGAFNTGAPPADWVVFGSAEAYEGRDVGVLNPTGTTLFSSTSEESNVAVVFLWNSGSGPTNRPAGLQQTLGDTLQLNTTYSLSVAVGNIANTAESLEGGFDFAGFPGYRVELLAGGNAIAFDQNTVAPGEGAFLTTTLNYNVGSADANAGGMLGIRLINLDAAAGIEVNFDRLLLTAVAIPEPAASAGIFALGAAVVLGVRRSRRARGENRAVPACL